MPRLALYVFLLLALLAGCNTHPVKLSPSPPATVSKSALHEDKPTVTLTEKAIQRLGLEAKAYSSRSVIGREIPQSALLFDSAGDAWVYVEVAPRQYQRQKVEVAKTEFAKTLSVVIVGAAELYGAESGLGK